MPSFSPLEALRATFSLVAICVSVVMFWRAIDGRMAFPRPIRYRMVRMRRIQVVLHGSIAVVWFTQAMVAAQYENPWPPSLQSLVVTLAVIYTVVVIAGVKVHQYMKLAELERIVGETPLVPDPESAGAQASQEARPIFHELNNRTGILYGRLVILRQDTMMNADANRQLDDIINDADELIELQKRVQVLIRALSVEMVGGET